MRRLCVYLALLSLLLLPPLAGVAAPGDDGFDTQTVMVYIVGSDLESSGGMATGDIREMLKARPDKERLNVLVLAGGTTHWMAPSIPKDRLSVFKIESSNPKMVHEMDSASMGDADTLSKFLHYAVDNYPADSYGLILWDHGGGPMVGFGVDTLYRGDGLTVFELDEALKNSPFDGTRKLEWLAFDACLMASFEVASLMSDYAKYMIASEETLPGMGVDYTFLKDLGQTRLTGPEAGEAIIARTYDFYKQLAAKRGTAEDMVTLSLMDLSRVSKVQDSLDSLFSNLDKGLEAGIYSQVARSRDGSKAYGRVGTTAEFDLIDLTDLSDNMVTLYPEAAGELKAAIREMVRHNRTNVPRSGGMSIYFPLLNKDMYATHWAQTYSRFDFAPVWRNFMAQFGEILLSDSLSNWTGSEKPLVSYDEETGEYYIQLSADQAANFEKAQYYVLAKLGGEEYMLTYMSSDTVLDDSNRVFANFGGKTMYIDLPDGEDSINPYMMEKENIGGIGKYHIPILVDRPTGGSKRETVSAEMLAEINKTSGEARLTGAIRQNEEGVLIGKRDIDLAEWENVFLPYSSLYLTRNENGDIQPLGNWAESTNFRVITYDAKKDITVRYADIEDDSYDFFVLISVIDTQGYVYSSELMPLSTKLGNIPAPVEPLSGMQRVAYPSKDGAPILMMDKSKVQVSLESIEPSGGDNTQAPDGITLTFGLENQAEEDASVSLRWLAVNEFMIPVDAYGGASPGEKTTFTATIPLSDAPYGSLAQFGVSQIDAIRLSMQLSFSSSSLFAQWYTEQYEIRTNIPVSVPAYEPPQTRMLLNENGFTVALVGTPYEEEGYYVITLKISNNSEKHDLIQLMQSTVNGIMAPQDILTSSLTHENVLPGTQMLTQVRIPMYHTDLPPELAEYQYMFDGLSSLEAIGVSDIREIMLRFHIDQAALVGEQGRLNVRKMLSPLHITLDGMENVEQTLDAQGETLFEKDGVLVVRLLSPTMSRDFYVRNDTDKTLHLTSMGDIRVDGVDYADNVPLDVTVSPRSSAYSTLFGFLPGIEPKGDIVTFYINVTDEDSNELIMQSDKITFPLQ